MNKIKNIANGIKSFAKPEAPQVIIAGIMLTLCAMAYFSMTAERTHNLKVEYETKKQRLAAVDSVEPELVQLGETDPTVRYAERQREASGIGLGLSLFVVRQRVSYERSFNDVQILVSEFAKSDIFPPQMTLLNSSQSVGYGIVGSPRGLYYIRFQPAPLKIEILAAGGNGVDDGAVFVLRLPETSAADVKVEPTAKVNIAGRWATLFVAPSSGNAYLPPPFAPAAEYQNSGWTIEPLRSAEISSEKLNQIQSFLQNYK